MGNVTFRDHRIDVEGAMLDSIVRALEETSGEIESQVKRNTRVDTGQTKNS